MTTRAAANGRVGELDAPTGTPSPIPLGAMRHDFGDTKHRNVYYEARATSRFLEYFAEYTSVTLTGTTAATVNPSGLAAGSTIVTDAATSVSYVSGVDFAEDDAAGTIARIPTGSIPSGATVDVQYVVGPVTRSSLEPTASPPNPLGTPAGIPSSARPAPPQVHYILPAFEWIEKRGTSKIHSARAGNILRVYLDRPWFSSGEGEQLGVIVADPPLGTVLPSPLEPLVTRYGRDPMFVSGPVSSTPALTDLFGATDTRTGVLLAEQTGATPWVDVAGFPVGWDTAHHLWFADIVVFAGASYWPFVRLALVRYQPSSLAGVEVSRVVQADFAQLAPDRAATLTFPTATSVHIVVSGVGYAFSGFELGPSMTAYAEVAQPGVTDPDLMWSPAGGAAVALPSSTAGGVTTWAGDLALPAARGSQPMRIVIGEHEQYPVFQAGDASQRLTYFDAIPI